MEHLIAQLHTIEKRLNAPVVTMEELVQIELSEEQPFKWLGVTLNGHYSGVRLVHGRDGAIAVNVDFRIDRPSLLIEYNKIRQEIGLLLCDQHGILVYNN